MACNLVAVPAYTAGVDIANGPMMFQPTPNPDDYFPAASLFQAAQLWPAQVKAADAHPHDPVGVGGLDRQGDAGGDGRRLHVAQLRRQGQLPRRARLHARSPSGSSRAGRSSSSPTSRPDRSPTTSSPPWTSSSYHPIILGEADVYGPAMAQWNTAGLGDNVYVRQAFQPLENASVVPAVQQYLRSSRPAAARSGSSASRRRRRSCCGPRRPSRAAPTSPASAWSTPCPRSTSGTGVGSRRSPTREPTCPPDCGHAHEADRHQLGAVLPQDPGPDGLQPQVHRPHYRRGRQGTTLNANRLSTKFLGPNVFMPAGS